MNAPVIFFWGAVGIASGIAIAEWSGVVGVPAWTFSILLGLIGSFVVGWLLNFLWRSFGPSRD
ncbi:MAG: hypothetical protein V2I43_23130 [Parvularcula sp.]|jgi:hypothetical protein|nr:hypothetical protein [Parvularcula sp.]